MVSLRRIWPVIQGLAALATIIGTVYAALAYHKVEDKTHNAPHTSIANSSTTSADMEGDQIKQLISTNKKKDADSINSTHELIDFISTNNTAEAQKIIDRKFSDLHVTAASLLKTKLLSSDNYSEIASSWMTIYPESKHSLLAETKYYAGDLPGVISELSKAKTDKSYPPKYYDGQANLEANRNSFKIYDRSGKLLRTVDAAKGSINKHSGIMSLADARDIRVILWPYDHGKFCCAMHFLVDGLRPDDALILAEAHMIIGNHKAASKLFRALAFIDYEGSLTEIEIPMLFYFLMKGDYESAKLYFFDGESYFGFSPRRYSDEFDIFFQMLFSNDIDKLEESMRKIADHKSTLEFPFNIYNGTACQPMIDAYLRSLNNGRRKELLTSSWELVRNKNNVKMCGRT